jgi:hypothetical protein
VGAHEVEIREAPRVVVEIPARLAETERTERVVSKEVALFEVLEEPLAKLLGRSLGQLCLGGPQAGEDLGRLVSGGQVRRGEEAVLGRRQGILPRGGLVGLRHQGSLLADREPQVVVVLSDLEELVAIGARILTGEVGEQNLLEILGVQLDALFEEEKLGFAGSVRARLGA